MLKYLKMFCLIEPKSLAKIIFSIGRAKLLYNSQCVISFLIACTRAQMAWQLHKLLGQCPDHLSGWNTPRFGQQIRPSNSEAYSCVGRVRIGLLQGPGQLSNLVHLMSKMHDEVVNLHWLAAVAAPAAWWQNT